jgi:hypothetical protein
VDRKVLITRITELADTVNLPSPMDRCWVENRSCPYGFPEGQYKLRPEGYCGSGGTCQTYVDSGMEDGVPQEEQDRIVDVFFESGSTRLAGILGNLADRIAEECPEEQLVLLLASDIIAERDGFNEELLRLVDTPAEVAKRSKKDK